MKRELEHFSINGRYGGSQDWMNDPWMHLGGCGALAAVDSCIFFSQRYRIKNLTPVVGSWNKDKYCRFSQVMKPYLRPRFAGINRLDLYTEGFRDYLKDRQITCIQMKEYPMGCSVGQAWEVFRDQIDHDYLVPVLLLNPINREWREYHWHWFLLNGYEIREDGTRRVKVTTYGAYEWLNWNTFWDERDAANGGMILYTVNAEHR